MMIKIYVIFKYITFYAKQTLATHLFNTIKILEKLQTICTKINFLMSKINVYTKMLGKTCR